MTTARESGRGNGTSWTLRSAGPDLDPGVLRSSASLPAGMLASNGPAHACVVDKIQQFAAELGSMATPPEEQIIALKFLLHFVGDLHHAAACSR